MSHTEPTIDELRAAYRLTRLRLVGISIEYAMTHAAFRTCLRGIAINARRAAERAGQPVPQQAALI